MEKRRRAVVVGKGGEEEQRSRVEVVGKGGEEEQRSGWGDWWVVVGSGE